MEKEVRCYGEIRNLNEDSRLISGYAVKFDSESQYMGFYEQINRSAIDEELIKQSDIFAKLDHRDDVILARSRYGEGSLKLELREDGLYYEFEAPKTQYGDELIEHIKRGEIFASSFCFALPLDGSGEVRTRDENNIIHRNITKIARLFDISPVYNPAYLETTCSKRTLDILEEIRKMKEEEELLDKTGELKPEKFEVRTIDKEEEEKEDDKGDDTANNDADNSDSNDDVEKVEDEKKEEKNESEKEDEEVESDKEDNKDDETDKEDNKEDKEDGEKTQRNKNKYIDNHNIMNTNFSLLRSIKNIAENKPLNAVDNAVIEAGKEELRNAGMAFDGQIQLPTENRAIVTVTSEGEDVVATEVFNIMEPLRAKNVLADAGATIYTGLVGNVKVPVMGASQVTWEGETAAAQDGAGTFNHVELAPKRLTAYIDISKQFLIQTENLSAEAKIRQDIVNAINTKLEQTILSADAGTTTKPAGMLNGLTTSGALADFASICDLEAGVEGNNVYDECKYVMDPKSKAVLRNMARSGDHTRLVMENKEVDGTPAFVTSNVPENTVIYGAWSNLVIGQWGAIDLIVDPYTQAGNGCVRLVINAFFDAKVARNEAFAFGTTGD